MKVNYELDLVMRGHMSVVCLLVPCIAQEVKESCRH